MAFLIDDLLLAPIKGLKWITEKVKEQAEKELYNIDAIKESISQLQELHDSELIDDEEFAKAEDKLLRRLEEAHEYMKSKGVK